MDARTFLPFAVMGTLLAPPDRLAGALGLGLRGLHPGLGIREMLAADTWHMDLLLVVWSLDRFAQECRTDRGLPAPHLLIVEGCLRAEAPEGGRRERLLTLARELRERRAHQAAEGRQERRGAARKPHRRRGAETSRTDRPAGSAHDAARCLRHVAGDVGGGGRNE